MRLGIFHTTLPDHSRKVGGVEIAVHRLAQELSAQGADVEVLSLTLPPDKRDYQHRRLFARIPALYKNRLARLFILPILLNFVRWEKYDVVHVHGDDWFWFLRPVPTVRTLNGSALREARSATTWRRKALQYLLYPLEWLSARLATLPVALGQDTADVYGIERTVSYGVDLELFRQGEKAQRPTILFVGTWTGRKRGAFVFDAFVKGVLPQVPDAQLLMAADHVESHANVVDLGFPSDEELAEHFRRSWVFALGSTYEGFGIPYLEAMASGTAIVTSDNPGARFVLAEGSFGRIVDDMHFAETLRSLLQDDEMRMELSNRGLERAQLFSWTRIARDHMAIYSEAIASWRKL